VRLVVQRVSRATVAWEGSRSEIGRGLLVLVGVAPADDAVLAARIARKIVEMRLFEDAQGRTNLSLPEVAGSVLVVSQFTLLADLSRGRRPGFAGAAEPDLAVTVYEALIEAFRQLGIPAATGKFGASMDVELVNQGPFTLVMDTDTLPS
jgi:D-tyrosyl-tRNA(Tyr) deacylase